MKTILIAAAVAVAALNCAACGTTATAVLNNVNESCDRHYDGSISAGLSGANFTGTFKADCHAADGKGAKVAPGELVAAPPAP